MEMRKLAFLGILGLVMTIACKDDEEGVTLPPLPELTVMSTLSGANEVPKNTSMVTGSVNGTLDQETRIFKLSVMYSDSADSTYADSAFVPTGWHIHKAVVDSTGPVVIDFGTNFATPLVFTDTLTAEQVKDLKAGMYYVNIHSKKYPAGEIRGQLKAEEK
jgi:hypothetical protein